MTRAAMAALVLAATSACKSDTDSASAATASSAGGRSADPRGGGGRGGRGAPSITLASTDVAVIKRDTIEESIQVSGDLRPIETIDVRARIEGDLIGVYVREGQRVTANQVLARFESADQESSERSAEADRVAADAELANAQWNVEQSAALLKAGAISQQQHRSAEQAVMTARSRLAAAEARVKTMSMTMRDTRVLSPASGIVAARSAESGEHVSRGSTLFSIVRNDILELTASVPSRQANTVRVGQFVHFVADGRPFTGRVARISPTIDPASRSATIYVEIPNPSGELKAGLFATGRVVSRVVPGIIGVPLQAVRQAQGSGLPYVYRIEGTSITVAPIQIGVMDERRGLAEALEGITEGDRVIVGNVGNLGRGMQVTVVGGEEGRRGRGGEESAGRGGRGERGNRGGSR